MDEGSGLVFSGGTLNGVTYDGTLDLSPNSSSVIITNGLTATGASGTGPGTVNLTGISDYVYFEGTQTFDKATINLGSSTGYDDAIYQYDNTGAGNETLTLGPNLIVNAASTNYVESAPTTTTPATASSTRGRSMPRVRTEGFSKRR